MGTIELAMAVWRQARPYAIVACGNFVIGFLAATLVWS